MVISSACVRAALNSAELYIILIDLRFDFEMFSCNIPDLAR